MRNKFLQKGFSIFSGLSLIFQSLLPGLSVLANPAYAEEEVTQTPAPTETPLVSPEPAADAETPIPTETPSVTVEPTVAPTDVVTPTPTPEVVSTPTLTPTDAPTDLASPQPTAEAGTLVPVVTEEPTIAPTEPVNNNSPPKDESLSVVVLNNISAPSIDLGAVAESGSATLTTDKADYAPTDVAIISGTGFIVGQTYTLLITSSDEPAVNFSTEVTADNDGTIIYAYQLDGIYRPNYQVVAKDTSGTIIATTSFTDAASPPSPNPAKFAQCANKNPTAGACDWIGSILQTSNSVYFEGMSVPQRIFDGGFGNGPHTIAFSYSYTKGGIHAYDFITGKNQGNSSFTPGITTFNDCQGLTGANLTSCTALIGTTEHLVTIPPDTFKSKDSSDGDALVGTGTTQSAKETAYQTANGDRKISVYTNASTFTLESVSPIVHSVATDGDTGDSDATLTLNFTLTGCPSDPGDPGCDVLVYFDGHLAVGGTDNATGVNWGPSLGSSNISGGPYHIKDVNLDGGGGSLDNQIQGADILVPNNASITIIKDAVPNDPQDFSYTTTGSGLSSFILDDDSDPTLSNIKVFSGLATGTYSVSETVPSGWNQTSATCSDGSPVSAISLQAGETVTCTFTNTKRGHVIIVKDAQPDAATNFTFTNNFSGSSTTFQLDDDNDLALSNTKDTEVLPGTYSVSETIPSGWDQTGASCNDNSPVNAINVSAGEIVTCTFTNTKHGHLRVTKHTVPSTDTTTDFSITASGTGTIIDPVTQTISGGETVDYEVTPGTYDVNEDSLTGWDMTGNTCVDKVVGPGETKSCTITNTKKPKLTVIKVTDPTDDNGQFNLFINETQYATDVGNSGTTNAQFANIGANTFAEAAGTGTVLSDYTSVVSGTGCGGSATAGTITLAAGDDKTCTITNTRKGSITIKKVTIGGNDSFTFTGDVSGSLSNNQTATQQVVPGNYHSTEAVLSGWALTDIICDDSNSTGDKATGIATFIVAAGENVTCTFTNNKPAAQIDLTPLTDANKIGDNHVISATVEVHNGNGSWGPAVDGTIVSFSITNSNGATAVFVPASPNTCTTTAGSCTITINSPTAGNVAVHASAGPVILGVTVNVVTDGLGDNSADAQKDYVNARISIAPNTFTNEVNNEHDFTVTVEQNTGSGFVAVPAGTLANAIASPVPDGGLDVSDCNDGVNASGQCTVTINSSVAGVFTIIARSTVVVNGVTFKLQTNGVGDNSGPATKTYVDAKIVLSPLTATNNVNSQHTITATVSQNAGTGFVNAPDGTLVTFNLLNNTAGAAFVSGINTCTTTGGTCSVDINSATPGSVDIHATTTFSVLEVSLTRATGDGLSGDSVDANKVYVAGKIIIEKQTLPDGSTQSFTFTPSYNSGATFDLTDGRQNDSGFLPIGTYSVSEAIPTGWDQTSAICGDGSLVNTISLSAGETVTCVFTNTQRGHLIVQKTTDPAADSQVFDILASGTGVITGGGSGTVTDTADKDYEVTPGTYSVDENVPTGWDKTGDTCQGVAVVAGETKTCLLTNTKRGTITIVKDAQPNDAQNFVFGGTLGAFTLDDDEGVVDPVDPLTQWSNSQTFINQVPGSYTVTETLPNAFWEFEGVSCVNADQSTHAITPVTNGGTITLEPGADVTCTFVNNKLGPTRTQGFWQTHTTYTSGVFASAPINGLMTIGSGTHTRIITNFPGAGSSILFGAYYSNIANKTTNPKKRTDIDRARMQLLQQLVTAKLNCAAFGCPSSVQTMIATADAAYAGTSVSAILASASALNGYNNSGDTTTIGNPGSATPKASQVLADKVFWDTP